MVRIHVKTCTSTIVANHRAKDAGCDINFLIFKWAKNASVFSHLGGGGGVSCTLAYPAQGSEYTNVYCPGGGGDNTGAKYAGTPACTITS